MAPPTAPAMATISRANKTPNINYSASMLAFLASDQSG
jgi:hypothetical protein